MHPRIAATRQTACEVEFGLPPQLTRQTKIAEGRQ